MIAYQQATKNIVTNKKKNLSGSFLFQFCKYSRLCDTMQTNTYAECGSHSSSSLQLAC